MSINWHTKSQGPKKKCAHFSRGRIHSCPAGTARNQGSFTSMALLSVQSFLSSTVHHIMNNYYFIVFMNIMKYYRFIYKEIKYMVLTASMEEDKNLDLDLYHPFVYVFMTPCL